MKYLRIKFEYIQTNPKIIPEFMDLSFSLSEHNVQFLSQKAIWIANISSIFPAFGQFTGLSLVKPKAVDKVFGVCEEKIIEIL